MPKPLVSERDIQQQSLSPSLKAAPSSQHLSPQTISRILREKRSSEYMNTMRKLDTGGDLSKSALDEFADSMRQQFPELPACDYPLGIVAKCLLGEDYEVHSLDITGEIITHYRHSQSLPGGLERARSLALHGSYAFIEVYLDRLCAVSEDGTVAIIT